MRARLPRAGVLLLSLLLLLAMALPAMALHGDTGATVEAVDEDGSFAFQPQNVTIEAGQNLGFVNASSAEHTLSAGPPGGPFDTGVVFPGEQIVVPTEHLRPGTYDFFCRVHPFMTGTLTVGE